jgi:hypothetical protein
VRALQRRAQTIGNSTVIGPAILDLKGKKLYDLKGTRTYKLSGDWVGHLPFRNAIDTQLPQTGASFIICDGGIAWGNEDNSRIRGRFWFSMSANSRTT